MLFNTDRYEIANTILGISKKYTNESENTLMLGTYGFLNEVLSDIVQNSVVMATEWGNEAFPIRSKFDRSILTNAITYNVEDINATPAHMDILLCFIEDELENLFQIDPVSLKPTVTIYKDIPIMVEDFEFHLDYDLKIVKNTIIKNGEEFIIYTANYNIDRVNPLSNINSQYLNPPFFFTYNNSRFIAINTVMRQVEMYNIEKKIITDDILLNRTLDFEIPNQLARFDIKVVEGDETIYLTPIVEGMPLNGENKFCYYTYINSSNIRIKFDPDSYTPSSNAIIYITLYTTQGAEGTFEYNNEIITTLSSESFNYNSLSALVRPISNASVNGVDRKSLEDLKQIIPKQILARGTISTDKDLFNYFNSIDNNKLIFYKRRHNLLEHLYYAYLIAKDNEENVIPTNTIPITASSEYIKTIPFENDRYIIKAGSIIKYENGIGKLITKNELDRYGDIDDLEETGFLYTTPITFVINRDPLSTSYYLDIINRDIILNFDYINQESILQFISSYINIRKMYLENDYYSIKMNIMQNINEDFGIADEIDEDGNLVNIKIAMVLIHNNLKYYVFANNISPNSDYTYTVEFRLQPHDGFIDEYNNIRIDDVYINGANAYATLEEETQIKFYIYVKQDTIYDNTKSSKNINTDIRGDADNIIPGMEGYTLCNIYSTQKPINLFYNYSDIVKSNIKWDKDSGYIIDEVPVVKYSYMNNVSRCFDFIDYIHYRKVCIDDTLSVLRDPLGIDFKFFNTYGPSKMFTIGYDKKDKLDKVNIKMKFKVRLIEGVDDTIISEIKNYIKEYVEDLNKLTNIHMTNLTSEITKKFNSDIKFIEFVRINNYDSSYQLMERKEQEYLDDVPEFLTIDLDKQGNPEIEIEVV